MAVVPTKGPKACNMVKNSEIWKAHVGKEESTRRQWQKGWGFLVDDYQRLADKLQEANDEFAMQVGENMLVRSPSPPEHQGAARTGSQGQRQQHRQQRSRLHSRRYSQPAAGSLSDHDSTLGGSVRLPAIDARYRNEATIEPRYRHHHRSLSMPLQTSAQIGWQSAVPSCLEIYHGPYEPKGDLVKTFSWPRESLPNP